MHNCVIVTVLLLITFLQMGVIFYPCSLAKTTDKVYQPWGLSSHGKFLGVLSSNFYIFKSM